MSGAKKDGAYRSGYRGAIEKGGVERTEREPTIERSSSDGDTSLKFEVIVDRFETLEEVRKGLEREGITKARLIFGIDYTMSNLMQGQKTFNGRSLHDMTVTNPYQQVICVLGETLETLDEEGRIPAYGFGDKNVKDKGIFPLNPEGYCDGFAGVLEAYNEITPDIKLSGPTNFRPLIEEATDIVRRTGEFHILVIVADGQVTSEAETIQAIIEASEYPLSIVMIGVGDGPWDVMNDFDVKLPTRKFDNFQFVDYHKVRSEARNPQAAVALAALMLVPDQHKKMRKFGMLGRV